MKRFNRLIDTALQRVLFAMVVWCILLQYLMYHAVYYPSLVWLPLYRKNMPQPEVQK